eukprot:TRINITY_DN3848_c0_g3_i2.p1 TRINITY_DN3848_c0_g3~~TRINITY_DN3848_c0_g3_i2.p1  ORF type:complete len:499 (+),score=39.23 TRINITY_DN3848_c0_g3_i2:41-1537(+)
MAAPLCGCGKPTWNGLWNSLCNDMACLGPPQPAPLCGCGRPTWNGQWNEICSWGCSGPKVPRPSPAGCARCGCGKPTWNGQWSETCSRGCPGPRVPAPVAPPSAGSAICGCGKPTYNGKWNETCSKSCRGPRLPGPAFPPGGGGPVCGCGSPTWNGQWKELCRRSCHGPRLVGPGVAAPRCGCGNPTWNGKWNETCSRSCPGARIPDPSLPIVGPTPVPVPVPGPVPGGRPVCGCGQPTWNNQWRQYCSRSCHGPRVRAPGDTSPLIYRLDPTTKDFADLAQYYQKTWDKGGKSSFSMPPIKDIWDVTDDNLRSKFLTRCKHIGHVGTFGSGTTPGNVQRRFHGTKMKCTFSGSPCSDASCGVCGIIKNGFLMKYAIKGNNPSSLFFGRGLYSTSASSSALRYAKKPKSTTIDGAIFVSLVACGKCEKLDGSNLTDTRLEDQDGPPSGCHSRVVNNPHDAVSYKNLASKYGTPLLYCDDEVVVFDEDAMMPRYLITFQ